MVNRCQCRKHPKYQAKRKPRLPCEACWFIWFVESGPEDEGIRLPSRDLIIYRGEE